MELHVLRYFVAVAAEHHFGRAAARLQMTQPPLSRAIQALEAELGAMLFDRSPKGATLTAAGTVLLGEARALLERADRLRDRVRAAAGTAYLSIGVLADSADEAGIRLAQQFRSRNPHVAVRVREADLTNPTAGLRAGRVDVALIREPFDTTGISTRLLRVDPVGAVVRSDDELAGRDSIRLHDLRDRLWFRFPDDVDPIWSSYWTGGALNQDHGEGPVVRTVQECVQSVLWSDAIGISPLTHAQPAGLAVVPVTDLPPSRLIVAWLNGTTNPLVRSFVQLARNLYRHSGSEPPASVRGGRPGAGWHG